MTPTREFSVVIPTYNRANTLPTAIRSALAQENADFEVIVVDDGSTDETESVVRNIADDRLRFIRQNNAGVCAARNRGVQEAIGRCVAFLDSDDRALPGWLAAFSRLFQQPQTVVACAGVRIKDTATGKETQRSPRDLGAVYDHRVGLFLAGAFAVRRDAFLQVGGYAEGLGFSENTDLCHRLVALCRSTGGEFVHVDQAFVVYNKDPQAWESTPERLRIRLKAAEYMMRTHGRRYQNLHPKGYANYCAIAGVCAAKLGDCERARRYFTDSVRYAPFSLRHIGRLLVACTPGMTFRVFGTPATGSVTSGKFDGGAR